MSLVDLLRSALGPKIKAHGHVRLATAGALVTAFTMAGDARAFCRTLTRLPGNWNPVAQGCYSDVSGGAKAVFWRNSCVGYSLHRQASKSITLEQATNVVAAAFDAWTASSCAQGGRTSITAVNLGPVDCGKAQYNEDDANQNVILFHDEVWPHGAADKTLGLTTLTFDTTTGELVGADMELNATQNLVVGDDVPPGSYSLASVLTHEVGHFWGLAHSADSSAIMFSDYKPTPLLTSDDVLGLCAIYAPDGSRATTDGVLAGVECNPRPRGGFISECSSSPGTRDRDTSESGGCSMGRSFGRHMTVVGSAWVFALSLLVARRRRAGSRKRLAKSPPCFERRMGGSRRAPTAATSRPHPA